METTSSELIELPKTPDAGVISLLEDALEHARKGDIVACGLAVVLRANRVSTNLAGERRRIDLLGAVRILEHRLLAKITDE